MKIGIQHTRQYLQIEGVRTAYYRQGSGPTVVLLHGGAPGACADLNWFRNFSALVDAGYDVVAFDQPGFGHSDLPPEWSLEFRYRHAQAFLEALGVKSLHLIGNSIGGLLSTLLAYRLKGRRALQIEGLILVAPFPHFEMSQGARDKYLLHRARLGGIEPTFESVEALCRNTFHDPDRATGPIVELRLAMLQEDNWKAYRKRSEVGNTFNTDAIQGAALDTPALVVWGLNDKSIPPEIGIQAMEHFSNAQFLFLPHCGHWPQTEHDTVFNHAVLGFLQSLAARNGAKEEG